MAARMFYSCWTRKVMRTLRRRRHALWVLLATLFVLNSCVVGMLYMLVRYHRSYAKIVYQGTDSHVRYVNYTSWKLFMQSRIFIRYVSKHYRYVLKDATTVANASTQTEEHAGGNVDSLWLNDVIKGKHVLDLYKKSVADGDTDEYDGDIEFPAQRKFEYLLNPSYICDQPKYLLIFVLSALQNFERRDVIRQTWGQYVSKHRSHRHVRLLFVLGTAEVTSQGTAEVTSQDAARRALLRESITHVDVLQVNVVERYVNLALKSAAALAWVSSVCHLKVKYVMKVDDDTFVNIPNLLRDLAPVARTHGRRFIMGHVISGATPAADPRSKWYLPRGALRGAITYPDYVSGGGYVMPAGLAGSLTRVSARVPLLPMEDVYVTGLLARAADVTLVHNRKFTVTRRRLRPCRFRFLITGHGLSPSDMRRIWTDIHLSDASCGPVFSD